MAVEMLEIKQEAKTGEYRQGEQAPTRWIAVLINPSGLMIIAQTPWRIMPPNKDLRKGRFDSSLDMGKWNIAFAKYVNEIDSDRMVMIGQLLADGWEPVGTNDRGQVVTMKRVVP